MKCRVNPVNFVHGAIQNMNSYKVTFEAGKHKLETIVHFKENVRQVRSFIYSTLFSSMLCKSKIIKIRKVKNVKNKT